MVGVVPIGTERYSGRRVGAPAFRAAKKQLQTRHIAQKLGFRAFKIDMFDVKHFRSLFGGHYDLPASRVRFCGFTGLLGSVEMDSVSSR